MYRVSRVTCDELCLKHIVHSRHKRSFYFYLLFNNQESTGHCQLQRTLSAGATNGSVLPYNHWAKFTASLAVVQEKEKKKKKKKKKRKLPLQRGKQARGQRNPHPCRVSLYVHRSEGKSQANSPGQKCRFGSFTGILFAKHLLRDTGVSKDDQTALLSLWKHLLWKWKEGGKKRKKKKQSMEVF